MSTSLLLELAHLLRVESAHDPYAEDEDGIVYLRHPSHEQWLSAEDRAHLHELADRIEDDVEGEEEDEDVFAPLRRAVG